LGINAISLLLEFLAELDYGPGELKHRFNKLSEMVAQDSDGTGLGIFCVDHTGALTQNPGLITYENGYFEIKLNLRSPVSLSPKKIMDTLKKKAEKASMVCEEMGYNPPFYIEPTHPIISTLTQVYQEMTGDYEAKPVAHGAGSYARMMDNFVPFGPSIPGEELCFHKQDEFIDSERLLLLSKIYAEALYRLANDEY
jgi:succinyl-diaminopimelate desuccinylase